MFVFHIRFVCLEMRYISCRHNQHACLQVLVNRIAYTVVWEEFVLKKFRRCYMTKIKCTKYFYHWINREGESFPFSNPLLFMQFLQ